MLLPPALSQRLKEPFGFDCDYDWQFMRRRLNRLLCHIAAIAQCNSKQQAACSMQHAANPLNRKTELWIELAKDFDVLRVDCLLDRLTDGLTTTTITVTVVVVVVVGQPRGQPAPWSCNSDCNCNGD